MASIKTNAGIQQITGRIDHCSRMVMRVKKYRDPITGEVIGYGPNEYYLQRPSSVPKTENQLHAMKHFSSVSSWAKEIRCNPNHPRYQEIYQSYIKQIESENPIKSFCNYIVSFLYQEIV